MEATAGTIQKKSHRTRNIILIIVGILLALIIALGAIFINPITTLAGGNGKVSFKSAKTTAAICEKSPDIYEITENEDGSLAYRLKSGVGSVAMSYDENGKVFKVTIIVDAEKITPGTTTEVVNQVLPLAKPILSSINQITLVTHALQEAGKISEITETSQFEINRKIGDFDVTSVKESGSYLVTTVFTR